MSRSMQWVLLWASASTVACLFALSWLPAAFDGDTYTQASALARGLLMNSSMPEGFELIGETAFEWPDRERVVFARAFHISH